MRSTQLEKDDVIQDALGRHIYEHFIEAKRNEWLEYIQQVSAVGDRSLPEGASRAV